MIDTITKLELWQNIHRTVLREPMLPSIKENALNEIEKIIDRLQIDLGVKFEEHKKDINKL